MCLEQLNGNNERNSISFSLEKNSIDLGMCSVLQLLIPLNTYPNQWNFSPEKRKCYFSHSVPGFLEEVKQWAHIALPPSCLVPCSGCSPCTWACSQYVPEQRDLTVQFFYASARKNVGTKDALPVSWMAKLTRFGIHFRKEFLQFLFIFHQTASQKVN